jgi:hypothetical protein
LFSIKKQDPSSLGEPGNSVISIQFCVKLENQIKKNTIMEKDFKTNVLIGSRIETN